MAVNSFNAQNPPVTTKGDVFTFSTIPTRLGVGANNTVLTADSSTATGLKWATPAAGANWTLLNTGGTSLSGTTTTVSGISGVDKILILLDGASTSSNGSAISIRLNTDTGNNYAFGASELQYSSTYTTTGLAGYGGLSYSAFPVGNMSNNSASIVRAYLLISGCNASGVKVVNFAGSGTAGGGNGHVGYSGGGYYNSSSTISSISVYGGGGTFDAGSVYVYTSA